MKTFGKVLWSRHLSLVESTNAQIDLSPKSLEHSADCFTPVILFQDIILSLLRWPLKILPTVQGFYVSGYFLIYLIFLKFIILAYSSAYGIDFLVYTFCIWLIYFLMISRLISLLYNDLFDILILNNFRDLNKVNISYLSLTTCFSRLWRYHYRASAWSTNSSVFYCFLRI